MASGEVEGWWQASSRIHLFFRGRGLISIFGMRPHEAGSSGRRHSARAKQGQAILALAIIFTKTTAPRVLNSLIALRKDTLDYLSKNRLISFLLFGWFVCLPTCSPSVPLSNSTAVKLKTGPEVGQPIPDFRLPDQFSRKRTFETIRGPQGALIVFYRSADW